MLPINDSSIFTDSWWIYEQVLDADYMHHRVLYQDLASFIGERFAEDGISVLDLGCGDTRHLKAALRGQKVTRYLGIDLSQAALDAARANLADLESTQTELIQADLLDAVGREGPGFDLVFSGFAIHHLSFEQKQTFFLRAAAQINDGGVLVIMDVALEQDEDRSTYLDRYCAWVMSSWSALPATSREAVCEHIRGYDFPEYPDTLTEMTRAAGLTAGRELSGRRWHRCWWFERASGSKARVSESRAPCAIEPGNRNTCLETAHPEE
jgi:SAM-dependent methyltransferase